jgi:hypothetical protein
LQDLEFHEVLKDDIQRAIVALDDAEDMVQRRAARTQLETPDI